MGIHTHTHADTQKQTHAATCTQMSTDYHIYTNAPINLSAHLSIFSGFAHVALEERRRGGEGRREEMRGKERRREKRRRKEMSREERRGEEGR